MIISNLLLILNLLIAGSDSAKYIEAYNYIASSSIVTSNFGINKFSNDYDKDSSKIKLWVSPERLSFDPVYLYNDIVEYEFPEVTNECKENLILILRQFPSANSIDEDNAVLNYLNVYSEYDFLVFFSEVNNNKVVAEVIPYHNNWPKKYEEIKMPGGVLKILFYYKDNYIVKVFNVKTSW
jgi:hypothetical protein